MHQMVCYTEPSGKSSGFGKGKHFQLQYLTRDTMYHLSVTIYQRLTSPSQLIRLFELLTTVTRIQNRFKAAEMCVSPSFLVNEGSFFSYVLPFVLRLAKVKTPRILTSFPPDVNM